MFRIRRGRRGRRVLWFDALRGIVAALLVMLVAAACSGGEGVPSPEEGAGMQHEGSGAKPPGDTETPEKEQGPDEEAREKVKSLGYI